MGSGLGSFLTLLAQTLIAFGLLSSAAYCLVMLYSARTFFVRRRHAGETDDASAAADNGTRALPASPPVSVLKPLKGLDVQLYENLRGLCEQDYDSFQLICGVADAGDPAVPVVQRLQREYPRLDVTLVVDARVYGSNCKVSNLHNMAAYAKHDMIVVADSDIRVPPDYLRRLIEPLRDPRVGLVTTLYRAVNTGGLPTLIESLCINTDWCHMVLVARVVERSTYAFGATIAIRRAVLDEIGGFLPIANHLADDYQLGQRVAARGYQLVLSDQILDTVIALGGWRRLFQHQLRWARTYRVCRPGGYFASIFTHSTLWAVAGVGFHGLSTTACLASAGLLGLRAFCAARLSWRYLATETTVGQLLLVVPKDLFVSAMWLLAFLGDTVTWSGRRFRIRRDGTMVDVTDTSAAPVWPQPPIPQPVRIGDDPSTLE